MKPYPGPAELRPLDDHDLFRLLLSDLDAMRRGLGGRRRRAWQPPTDVDETDQNIVLKVSIPGVAEGQVTVEVNGEVITICGHRGGPDPGSVVAYHQMEINNGYFERRIVIHRPFDPDEATAEYRDGFLYVRVPKAPQLVKHVLTIRVSI